MSTINMESSLFGVKADNVSAAEGKKAPAQHNLTMKSESLDQIEALVKLVKLAAQETSANDQHISVFKNQIQNNAYKLDIDSLVEHLTQELSI